MLAWLEGVAGSAYATAMMWTLGALLLLVVLLLFIKVIRSLSFGTFVSGGRNRKTRLAVMDATAVDSHRRLVLVRRDDVEHLILIGGPTDVVVEQNIRMIASLRRPAEEPAPPREVREVRLPPDAHAMTPAAPEPHAEAPRPPEPVQPAPPPAAAPVQAVVPPAQARPAPAPLRPVSSPLPAAAVARPQPAAAAPAPAPRPAPTLSPLRPAAPVVAAPSVRPTPAVAAPPPAQTVPPRGANDQPPSLDDALLEELEVTLERNAGAQAAGHQPALPSSVEDEMAKLLGDLARPRR